MKVVRIAAGLAVVLALLAFAGAKSRHFAQAKQAAIFKDNRVAVLPISGAIESSDEVVRWLRRFDRQVRGVRAVVLSVDSPGGGVGPSQEIYEAVKKLKANGKTVVVSMSSVAASGAYYLACPADRIFANPGTLTGSIGVYVEKLGARGLLDKVGLKFEVIKSGVFKDTGGISRDYSPAERAYLQGVINDVYDQFVSAVAEEREAPLAQAMEKNGTGSAGEGPGAKLAVKRYVKTLSDGRIYTGREALRLGLVDELGDLDDAIESAAKLAGIQGEPDVVTPKIKVSWTEYLTGLSKTDLRTFLKDLAPAPGLSFSYRAW